MKQTTIAAISTPPGQGGVAMVRLSGPDAVAICERVFAGKRQIASLKGYEAAFGRVVDADGRMVDECVALRFQAPKSYTGEEVVELSCHGGRYLQSRLLQAVLEAGATLAAPGEFTRRAVANGKLTLTQAEGVADLIAADTKQAAQMAVTLKSGKVAKEINLFCDRLLALISHLTAYIDFPEEDVDQLSYEALTAALEELGGDLQALLAQSRQGMLLKEGIVTVLAGAPNAGKSTLMNRLCGTDESIVTPIAGTTRDIVSRQVVVFHKGLELPLQLKDTAGLNQTADLVEAEGVRRARKAIEGCQLLLLLWDATAPLPLATKALLEELAQTANPPYVILVQNKTDLTPEQTFPLPEGLPENAKQVAISAATGAGVEGLKAAICDAFQLGALDPAAAMLANGRQMDAATRAAEALGQAVCDLKSGITMDAVGVLLQEALEALYALTGRTATESIIEAVFSTFCVGK